VDKKTLNSDLCLLGILILTTSKEEQKYYTKPMVHF